MGVTLLRRITRRVDVTPAGAGFLIRVRQPLQDLDHATNEAQLVAAGAVGRLAVGSVTL